MGFNGVSWTADFAHLHVASSYSLRYGTATPAALVTRAAALGMPALALTDRDGLYGAFKHAVACGAAGLAPILGADLALAAAGGGSHGARRHRGLGLAVPAGQRRARARRAREPGTSRPT